MISDSHSGNSRLLQEFLHYTFFSVLGMIGVSCYILADTYFIAEGLGSTGLAALNLAIPVYSMLCGIGQMLGMGGAIQFGHSAARGEHHKGDRIFSDTLLMGMVIAVPLVLLGALGCDPLAGLMGADAQTLADTSVYLKWLLIFSPFFLANYILQAFLRNDGSPHLSMNAMLAGSFLNIVLDWFFIFPCNMGMFGAILATCLSPVCSVLVMLVHFRSSRNTLHIVPAKPDGKILLSDFTLGFPSLVTQVSAGVVMMVLNSIFLKLTGNVGVAAYGVIANTSCVTTAVFNGISQGVQPLISQAAAVSDLRRSRLCMKYAQITGLIFSALLCFCTLVFPDAIASVFNGEQNQQLQQIAVQGLQLYFLGTPFMGICVILSTWFAAMHKPIPAHVLSLLRGLILVVPFSYLFAIWWNLTGAWLAVPAAEAMTAAIGLVLYLLFIRKEKNQILQEKQQLSSVR